MPHRHSRPTDSPRQRLQNYFLVHRWWREVLFVGVIYGLYELVRNVVVTSGDQDGVLAHGFTLLHFEQRLHLDPEHALNTLLTHSTPAAVVCSYYYAALHYLVTPIVLIWMYLSHIDFYRRARSWILVSTVIGLIGFVAFPTAPPRLLAGAGFHDTLADVSNWGWWGGDASAPKGVGGITDQFAAMPSLHVGWALWCGLLLFRFGRRRWVRAFGVLYPLVTCFVVMATGNHYLVDTLAGVACMGVGAALTWGVIAIRNRVVMAHLLKA